MEMDAYEMPSLNRILAQDTLFTNTKKPEQQQKTQLEK